MALNQIINCVLFFAIIVVVGYLIREIKIYGGIKKVVQWHNFSILTIFYLLALMLVLSFCR